jgi:SAM-dependent methyltransferase
MNWKLKAHTLALLSRLPWGSRIYHTCQARFGTNQLDADESVHRALEIVQLIREAGRDPFNGVYVEIGTGWRPFLPFLLRLLGADRIITFDVNRWLTEAYAQETFQALESRLPAIAEQLGLGVSDLQKRYQVAARRSKEGLLQAFEVEYRCPADARRTGLANGSVDFVCSSNVLEHVPPEILREIHEESIRILRPGGLAVHRFNPGDHASHIDSSATAVNFLRYSGRQWHWYGGSGLGYHNRLRCIQHQSLLEAAEFSVLIKRVRIDSASVDAIRSGKQTVHPDFAGFLPEELAADYMWLVGMRPQNDHVGVNGN